MLLYLPHILDLINKAPADSEADLSSVSAVFTAGMPVGKSLQEKLFRCLPSLRMFFTVLLLQYRNGYGKSLLTLSSLSLYILVLRPRLGVTQFYGLTEAAVGAGRPWADYEENNCRSLPLLSKCK